MQRLHTGNLILHSIVSSDCVAKLNVCTILLSEYYEIIVWKNGFHWMNISVSLLGECFRHFFR